MKTKTLTVTHQLDPQTWSQYTARHPRGNIFHTPEMSQVFARTKNYETVLTALIDHSDGSVKGLHCALIQKDFAGILGRFTSRAITWAGPLVDHDDPQLLDLIIKGYNKYIKSRAIYSQFRNLWPWTQAQKEIMTENGYQYEEHLDILMDLTQDQETLLSNVHKERRHNIRRSEKKGTQFKELTSLEEIETGLALVEETYKRVKLPVAHPSLFTAAYEILYPIKMVRYFGAVNQDKLIGVRIVLPYKEMVYDWYAGGSHEERNKYPNDYLPWQVILWCKQAGHNVFDFGGAGKPNIPYGVRDYKLKFGGQLVNYGRFMTVHKPLLMTMGKQALKIYQKLR